MRPSGIGQQPVVILQPDGVLEYELIRELGVSYATVNRWENSQARTSRPARARLDVFVPK